MHTMTSKPKLLLHTCCGCCGALIPQILAEDYEVDLYYFNPNIHPQKEYERRRADAQKMAESMGLNFIAPEYNSKPWFEKVRGFEKEPEGGKRCPICFRYRLTETAKFAKENGYEYFASTLTVGRNKKAETINPIGEAVAEELGIKFLAGDWKKRGVQDVSCLLAEKRGIIRQNYCGCNYSYAEMIEREKEKEDAKKPRG